MGVWLSVLLDERGKREMDENVGASQILYVLRSLITPCHASDGCFDTKPLRSASARSSHVRLILGA